MACELLKSLQGICDYQTSGVERLWLANKNDITGLTYDVDGTVATITFADTKTFLEIVPAQDTATYADTLVVNGSRRNFSQEIGFGIAAMNQEVVEIIESLGLGNFVALVYADDSFRLFGHKGSGLRASDMPETSGTAGANDGAISVTLTGNNKGKAPFVAKAGVEALNIL